MSISNLRKSQITIFATIAIVVTILSSIEPVSCRGGYTVIPRRRNTYPAFKFRPLTKAEMTMFKPSSLCPDTNDGGPPYRYHIATQQCYMVGGKKPCGELMAFTMVDEDFGTCDCDQSLRCGRPLIYWPETKRCYYVNDQGPCGTGKWLVFGLNHSPVCKRNTCLAETSVNPSRGVNFWFIHKRKCYRTGTRGYCSPGQVLQNSWEAYKPTCSGTDFVSCKRSHVQQAKCLPGMKTDYSDRCVRNPFRGQSGRYGQQQEEMPNIYHMTLE